MCASSDANATPDKNVSNRNFSGRGDSRGREGDGVPGEMLTLVLSDGETCKVPCEILRKSPFFEGLLDCGMQEAALADRPC